MNRALVSPPRVWGLVGASVLCWAGCGARAHEGDADGIGDADADADGSFDASAPGICGDTSCDLPEERCCSGAAGAAAYCAPAGVPCEGPGRYACDGRDDCDGALCCAVFSEGEDPEIISTSCAPTCATRCYYDLMYRGEECSGPTCETDSECGDRRLCAELDGVPGFGMCMIDAACRPPDHIDCECQDGTLDGTFCEDDGTWGPPCCE